MRQSWGIVEPGTPFVENWHHGAICEHLEAVTYGQLRKLVISVPPEHTKSTIAAKCWPAWWWLHQPYFDWIFASYNITRSINDSVGCRRIIESAWYRKNWGDLFYLTSDQNQKGRFENSQHGERIATSIGGSTGEHADAVVADDPNDIRDQFRPKQLARTISFWDNVMTRCVNDPRTSRFVAIQQRIHPMDLSGHLLSQGGYDHLVLSTEYNPARSKVTVIGWRDPRKQHKEFLWPKRFGDEEIADAKVRLGIRGFNAQHQQDPTQEEGVIFKREDWKHYANDPKAIVQQMDEVILSMDCAFKDADDNSKVACHAWGRKGADTYLLARDTEHRDFVGTLGLLERMSNEWPRATAKIIEDKANGPAVINAAKQKIPGLIPWPPKGSGPMGSKVARAVAMQPRQEAGNVWLPDPDKHPWVAEFIEICAAFPGCEFDDDIDAMSQAHDRFGATATIVGTEDMFNVGSGGKSYWKRAG